METENTNPQNEENRGIESLNDNPAANTKLSSENSDYDSDMERYEQASRASEPSFTLETNPEPGSLEANEPDDENAPVS